MEQVLPTSWVRESFSQLEATLNGEKHALEHQLRKTALDRFLEVGFPNTRNEDWKYTNLSALNSVSFRLSKQVSTALKSVTPLFLENAGQRLVFVNGVFARELSVLSQEMAGVQCFSLSAIGRGEAPEDFRQVVSKRLARAREVRASNFSLLSQAFARDGVAISIKRQTVVKDPIQLLFITTDEERIFLSPQVVIIAEEGSQSSIVESHFSLGGGEYLNNILSSIELGAGAQLRHYKLQQESERAYHISTSDITQEKGSHFSNLVIHLGGGTVREEIHTALNGEHAETTLLGLSLGKGTQHIDNTTVLNHIAPNCQSREIYKGIYSDQSRGVFFGTIVVQPEAQKTNAIQSNNSLLLSDSAAVDTRPQLKIWADDVRCTHGATIGQLDEQALFYLRSRGIDRETAQGILLQAFVGDILEEVKEESVRKFLDSQVKKRFPGPETREI